MWIRLFAWMIPLLPLVGTVLPLEVSAAESDEPPRLVGRCDRDDLDRDPYASWARPGYEDYEPAPAVVSRVRTEDLEGVELEVFFGTWCGDSRREVPRLLKLFDVLGIADDRVAWIAVDGEPELHKRSPGGEERGRGIFRVPTLIVRRAGRELGRIVEYPVLSLERDLIDILHGEPYVPNYPAYPTLRAWLESGWLSDGNVSARGLANRIRGLVSGEGDVAAAARVLLYRGEVPEALKLFEVNTWLFRERASTWMQLADARMHAGEPAPAREAAERALRLDPDPERIDALLEVIAAPPQPASSGPDS